MDPRNVPSPMGLQYLKQRNRNEKYHPARWARLARCLQKAELALRQCSHPAGVEAVPEVDAVYLETQDRNDASEPHKSNAREGTKAADIVPVAGFGTVEVSEEGEAGHHQTAVESLLGHSRGLPTRIAAGAAEVLHYSLAAIDSRE